MKNYLYVLIAFSCLFLTAQEQIIELPYNEPVDIKWDNPESEYIPKSGNSPIVANISKPSMIVYRPTAEKQNGISVIIAPGGGLHFLSILHEGENVAKWLNDKGITAFILKYRVMPTGEDAIKDLLDIVEKDNDKRVRQTKKLMPFSTQDGLNAISHVRNNATDLGIDPNKIGFMGFSGGGCVLFGVVNECTELNKPNFLVPIYPGTDLIDPEPNELTPPTLFIAAANDKLIDATVFTSIFNKWHKAGVKTSMYMYADGGHGFATWLKGFPVSNWLDRFYEWVTNENTLKQ